MRDYEKIENQERAAIRPPRMVVQGDTLKPSIVYQYVHAERERAHLKHGARGNSREDQHWTEKEWLPILVEEVGEVAHCLTYDADVAELRAELVQVAAMATAWIDAIDRGDPEPKPGTLEFDVKYP